MMLLISHIVVSGNQQVLAVLFDGLVGEGSFRCYQSLKLFISSRGRYWAQPRNVVVPDHSGSFL